MTIPELTTFLAAIAALSGVAYNIIVAQLKNRGARRDAVIRDRNTNFSEAMSIIQELRRDKQSLQSQVTRLQRENAIWRRRYQKAIYEVSRMWKTSPEIVELQMGIDTVEGETHDDDNGDAESQQGQHP